MALALHTRERRTMRAPHKIEPIRRAHSSKSAERESEKSAQDDFYSAKTADELVARLIADLRASA
jgi:hypothetical protein